MTASEVAQHLGQEWSSCVLTTHLVIPQAPISHQSRVQPYLPSVSAHRPMASLGLHAPAHRLVWKPAFWMQLTALRKRPSCWPGPPHGQKGISSMQGPVATCLSHAASSAVPLPCSLCEDYDFLQLGRSHPHSSQRAQYSAWPEVTSHPQSSLTCCRDDIPGASCGSRNNVIGVTPAQVPRLLGPLRLGGVDCVPTLFLRGSAFMSVWLEKLG